MRENTRINVAKHQGLHTLSLVNACNQALPSRKAIAFRRLEDFPLHELVALSSFLAPFSIQLHLVRKPSVIPNFQRSTAQPKRPCQLIVMGRPRAGIVANSCHAEWVVFKFPLVQGNVISDG